jgi:hypothetical protein
VVSQEQLGQLRDDYASVTGEKSLSHFYCPVLFRDEDVQLCDGHIINAALPGACRKTVIQREDVDNFFGIIEAEFITLVRSHSMSFEDMIFDKSMSAAVRPRFTIGGNAVEHYRWHNTTLPTTHTLFTFEGSGDRQMEFVVKKPSTSIGGMLDNEFAFSAERNYRPEATATLIKSAHLILFHLFGYRYVLSAAGRLIGKDILGSFFTRNHRKPKQKWQPDVATHFGEWSNIVWPMDCSSDLNDTLEGGMAFMCLGCDDHPVALGVFIKTEEFMHAVVVPASESIASYLQFVNDPPPSFAIRLMRLLGDGWEIETEPRRMDTPPELRKND